MAISMLPAKVSGHVLTFWRSWRTGGADVNENKLVFVSKYIRNLLTKIILLDDSFTVGFY